MKKISLLLLLSSSLFCFAACQSGKENNQTESTTSESRESDSNTEIPVEDLNESRSTASKNSEEFVPYFATTRFVAEEEIIDTHFNFDNPKKSVAVLRVSPNVPYQPLNVDNFNAEGVELSGQQLIWKVRFELFQGFVSSLEVTSEMTQKTTKYQYYSSGSKEKGWVYLRSQNPKTQLIEELKMNQADNKILYRSEKNKTWIDLRVEKKGINYQVFFPNQQAAYTLNWDEGMMSLTCINPDGSKQTFYGTNLY